MFNTWYPISTTSQPARHLLQAAKTQRCGCPHLLNSSASTGLPLLRVARHWRGHESVSSDSEVARLRRVQSDQEPLEPQDCQDGDDQDDDQQESTACAR